MSAVPCLTLMAQPLLTSYRTWGSRDCRWLRTVVQRVQAALRQGRALHRCCMPARKADRSLRTARACSLTGAVALCLLTWARCTPAGRARGHQGGQCTWRLQALSEGIRMGSVLGVQVAHSRGRHTSDICTWQGNSCEGVYWAVHLAPRSPGLQAGGNGSSRGAQLLVADERKCSMQLSVGIHHEYHHAEGDGRRHCSMWTRRLAHPHVGPDTS